MKAIYGQWIKIKGVEFIFRWTADGVIMETLKAAVHIEKKKTQEIHVAGTDKSGKEFKFTVIIEDFQK